MAQIEVKFNNSLKQSKIVIPLNSPGYKEIQDTFTGNKFQGKQTVLYGIRVPLIKINDIVIDYNDILYMSLDGSHMLPRLNLVIYDTKHLIKGLQNPSSESEVRLQILPRVENAYKKIDLTFYIKSYSANGDVLSFSCIYKVIDLYTSRIKCFGEVTSYELFEQLATECKLGFASNVSGSGNDKRYIYCANNSYESLMSNVIQSSGDSGNSVDSRIMYDCWVDFWNNINFVDSYERFNTVDSDDDMMIYVSTDHPNIGQDSMDQDMFFRTPAVLSNDPAHMDTELYIGHYNTINKSKSLENGSDRIISIYNDNDREALDYFLQDGDQSNDVFAKSEYLGECPREFNYLLARACRDMMEDKMKAETIEVTVNSPLIQLMRGGKVNVKWYDTDADLARKKQGLGIKNDDISTNIQIDPQEGVDTNPNPLFRINKQVSGQYYILSSIITFENNTWSNTLTLTRPRDQKQKYIDLSEETSTIS